MGKDLEIKGDEEVPACQSIARMKQPYQTASLKDWEGFKEFYESNPDSLFHPLTINKDYAFHIAASTGNKQLLRDLVEMIPTPRIQEALTQLKDEYGNTALHEVATSDNVDAAEFLVKMLWKSIDETEQIIEDHEIDPSCKMDQFLKVKNNLGETPLYRAAALGNAKMVKYLAGEIEKVGDTKASHFYRYDTISIFHIAVLAQHFDIAIWLLKKHRQLGEEKDMNGLTGFHMLALMPSAFRSKSHMSILKKLIYYCLPNDYDADKALAELPSSQREDVETGMRNNIPVYTIEQPKKRGAISRMYFTICSCLKEWAAIDAIWKEKNKHESALRLAKFLAKQDFSWKYSYKAEEDSTISLGLGKGGEKGTQNSKEGSKATTSEKSETLLEIPLLLAAREGIEEIFNEILNEYPQAVDHVSNNGHNVLHLAILHRQDKIFERLKKMEMSVQKLASKIDNNGNTILHQVAETKHYEGGKRPGPAFQFQEELTWYQVEPSSLKFFLY
ncbi:hypothetical protein Patl1_09847 [Pistacia atlantica]|uniref:Uncharacterized protein n=1 Tax=Pistacia atlantica TaxID=434234 RepID=A0ACC1A5W2_9ROSI|nr:hypothetical protein Patl1_09847 [Pistacia atlantica]